MPASCVVPPTGMMPHYEMQYDEYEAVEETEETSAIGQPTGHLWTRRVAPAKVAKPVVTQPARPVGRFPAASTASNTRMSSTQVRSVSYEVAERVPAFTPTAEEAEMLVPEPLPHSSRPTYKKTTSSPLKKSYGYKHSVY